MITNVAELLTAFVEVERQKLDEVKITHAPTIGDMYEGLSHELLSRAIPGRGLEVVAGFAEDQDGTLSDELDCMLVTDKGRVVPKTTKYIVPIHAIIAIVQVKKVLYRSDVKDGFDNLRSIFRLRLSKSQKSLPDTVRRGFHQIAQVPLPDNPKTLPVHLLQLFHLLTLHSASPVRILLGYHGFKNEQTFRTGLLNLLTDLAAKKEKGWGPIAFPDFIIGPRAVASKNIAMPWGCPFQGEWLPWILTSGLLSPIEVMLEAVWSRLNYLHLVGADLFGDDLKKEQWGRLIDVKLLGNGNATYDLWPAKIRGAPVAHVEWEPAFVDEAAFRLTEILCKTSEPVQISKAGPPDQIAQSVKTLEEAGIAARDLDDTDKLHLITEECTCVVLPDGRFAVGDNNSGRLMNWVNKHFFDRRADVFLLSRD